MSANSIPTDLPPPATITTDRLSPIVPGSASPNGRLRTTSTSSNVANNTVEEVASPRLNHITVMNSTPGSSSSANTSAILPQLFLPPPSVSSSAHLTNASTSTVGIEFSISGSSVYESHHTDISIEEKELLANIQELQMELNKLKVEQQERDEEQLSENTDAQPRRVGRLLVVAKNLPVIVEQTRRRNRWIARPSTGGLDKLMCLSGLRQSVVFFWVGYVGRYVPKQDQEAVRKLLYKYQCIPVFLNDEQAVVQSDSFSSNVLWPLFHYVPEPVARSGANQNAKRYNEEHWKAYQQVNQAFAEAIHRVYRKGFRIWIHDHHLMLLPAYLRERVPRAIIGLFLHTPFPSSDVYRRLPVRQEILEGLLSADLVGFQTYDYARHFLSACQWILGVDCSPRGVQATPKHFTSLGVYPIGIDMNHFTNKMAGPTTQHQILELTKKFEGKRILLGIDRLDYIKGIPHKLLAMEVLLNRHPEWRHNVVLVQLGMGASGVESHETADATAPGANRTKHTYRDLLVQVNQLVGRINGAFGTLNYNPIHFINQATFYSSELCALYYLADVCVVTSTRDGMNLVSHEFVVCQNQRLQQQQSSQHPSDADQDLGPGALVLSEFAGSAQSLSGAILVNPWDTEDVARAMHQALTMTKVERELRQQKLYRYVSTNSVAKWAEEHLQDLNEAVDRNYVGTKNSPPTLIDRDVFDAYRRSKNRVIIYNDGTLTPVQSLPQLATISSLLKTVSESLSEDGCNTVFIVSARGRRFLETWLSDVKVGMAAEDGLFYRMSSLDEWKTMTQYNAEEASDINSWKTVVQPVMQSFTDRTPGSYLESKEGSLTWHYRDSDPHFGSWQAKDLQTTLERRLNDTALEVVQGNRVVVVKYADCSKSKVVEGLLKYLSTSEQIAKRGEVDFIFCVGDDASDEQMFQSLDRIKTESRELSEHQRDSIAAQEEPDQPPATLDEDETEEGEEAASSSEEKQTTIFSQLAYEPIRLHEDVSMYTVHVGSSDQPYSSCASHCVHSLGQLRRILRGFAEISRSAPEN